MVNRDWETKQVNISEPQRLHVKEISFQIAENSPPGDAALFRAAADWLVKNDKCSLISATYQGYFGGEERAELKLYFDD